MFRNPFSFKGRIRRTEYGISIIIYIAVLFVLEYVSLEFRSTGLFFVLIIPLYWFVLAQSAKRCHDRGNSAWYMFIPFYSLWLLFGVGELGDNDYGPDPKNPSTSAELEIDAFALNNYTETKNYVIPIDEKFQFHLNQINSYIKEEKQSIFGSNKRETLLELISSLCYTREEAILLLDCFTSNYGRDMITDLCKISKSYDAIKENVQIFIDLGVIESQYPHQRIS
jgi:uncharacterized membrane protein YhaH (DUF805 family)